MSRFVSDDLLTYSHYQITKMSIKICFENKKNPTSSLKICKNDLFLYMYVTYM